MASNQITTLPTADCAGDGIIEEAKPEATRLVAFEPKVAINPATAIERALRYTKDPKGYLVDTLGQSVFEERRPKLCIPDEIDKDVCLPSRATPEWRILMNTVLWHRKAQVELRTAHS